MKTQTLKDIEKRMSKEETAASNKEIVEDLVVEENAERKRKWMIYHKAKKWIIPNPSWTKKKSLFKRNDFERHFKISGYEADKLIKKLIKDKKLVKTDETGVYKAIRICSMCGRTFDDWDLQENNYVYHHFGYGSRHDLQIFEVDLCCDCYDKIIDTILPLFPCSPIRDSDMYSDPPEYHPYAQDKFEHDNDPY